MTELGKRYWGSCMAREHESKRPLYVDAGVGNYDACTVIAEVVRGGIEVKIMKPVHTMLLKLE